MKTINYLTSIIAAITLFSCNNHHEQTADNTKFKDTTVTNNKHKINVLFVLTSHDKLGDTGEKTGFWLEEFAAPYYTLHDKGVAITIATPEGGKAPIDPRSELPDAATAATKRYNNDEEVQEKINTTEKLITIKPENYDAVFYPGGHGPVWDLSQDTISIELIETFNKAGKPMAFVCHAPAALKKVKGTDGEPLVKGKQVTGFANSEEEAVQLKDAVPFLVENMLIEKGGIYSKGANWSVYVLKDGNLITGQNPASSQLAAEQLFDAIK